MPEDLDPEAAQAIAKIAEEGLPPWHTLSVEAARRLEAEAFATVEPPPVEAVQNLAIDGPGGDLPLRIYRPEKVPAPTIVFFHGGGFVLGSPDTVEGMCLRLCDRANAVVVSVDYRLAPEHPFPAALEDAYTATNWVAQVAPTIGGDGDNLVIAGSSAGAALATLTAMRVRDEGGPDIERQLLAYPMADPSSDYDSRDPEFDTPILYNSDIDWFWNHYLRSPIDRRHPRAAPLNASDLSGLPPATVVTAGVDVLRDEGIEYATALDDAGVDVDHRHYSQMPHAFLSLAAQVSQADAALNDLAEDVHT